MKVTVIGVAGGTGSGKSTLVKRLQDAFKGEDVATICHDYYYKAHPELTYEERTKLNYDHPQAFDTDIYHTALATLGKEKAASAVDDAEIVTSVGFKVMCVECGSSNFKVTYPEDIKMAEILLKAGKEESVC